MKNHWLDYGGFLLVIYTMIYVVGGGKQPEWIGLYSGAIALVALGLGLEIYRKVTNKNE